jgi:hypothetical protein
MTNPEQETPPADLITQEEAATQMGISPRLIRAAIDSGRVRQWVYDRPKGFGRRGMTIEVLVSLAEVTKHFRRTDEPPQSVVPEARVGTHYCHVKIWTEQPNNLLAGMIAAMDGQSSSHCRSDYFLRLTSEHVHALQDDRQKNAIVQRMVGNGHAIRDIECLVVGR